jgi:hypothetical protein
MNASMQFGDAFDLPLDEMDVGMQVNDDMYHADGSFALGEIMQHTSATHFADVAVEPSATVQSAVQHSLTHELEGAATTERSFLESLYDSLRNSFQRQSDNDSSTVPDQLQASVSESGHLSGQLSMTQQTAAEVTPRVAMAMMHGKTKLYVSRFALACTHWSTYIIYSDFFALFVTRAES